jgi:hypothetical protein
MSQELVQSSVFLFPTVEGRQADDGVSYYTTLILLRQAPLSSNVRIFTCNYWILLLKGEKLLNIFILSIHDQPRFIPGGNISVYIYAFSLWSIYISKQ